MAVVKNLSNAEEAQILSDEMMTIVLPVTAYIGVEAVIGFFGNILILLVYSRYYSNSNFRIFVLFMAMVDLTSCMTTLPLEMFSQMNWYTYYHGWMCSLKTFLNVYTAWGSASVLVLLAYDRNRKICRPLRQQILPAGARRLCIGSIIMSLCIAAPVLALWGKQTYTLETHGKNLTVSVCEKSNKFKDTIYPFAYILTVYIVPTAIMVLVLMVLNVMTVLKLFGKDQPLSRMKSVKVTYGSKASLSTISVELETTSVSEERANSSTKTVRDQSQTSVGQEKEDSMARKTRALQKFDELPRNDSDEIYDYDSKDQQKDKRKEKDICFHTSVPFGQGFLKPPVACSGYIETNSRNLKEKRFQHSNDTVPKQTDSKHRLPEAISEYSHNQPRFSSNNNTESRKLEVMKRKTRIMLVLTSVFAITMTTYVVLTFLVSMKAGILKNLTNSGKVFFFFFWRLYFMNTIINPILYGFMDPRFRSGLATLVKRRCKRG